MTLKLYNKKTGFTLQHTLKANESVQDIVKNAGAPARLHYQLQDNGDGSHGKTVGDWTLTVIDGVCAPVESL